MNDRQKSVLIRWLAIGVGILLLIIIAAEGISTWGEQKIDTTEGLELLVKAEEADITVIENKIANLESNTGDAEGAESEDIRSTKEKFASTVIMGDSRTLAFAEYDVLNTSSVVAEIGIKISDMNKVKAQIAVAKEMNPQTIVLCYGINDIMEGVSLDDFLNSYKEIIDCVKEELPDTKIYVNSIFPVQESVTNSGEVDTYNEELRTVCDKKQIAYMNNTELPDENDYEEDGIHFVADFYEDWAARIAEVAEL